MANKKNDSPRPLLRLFNLLTLLGGVLILISLSVDIMRNRNDFSFDGGYLALQFWVCVVFLIDFFLNLYYASDRGRFFLRNIFFLLVSVPYLNILMWTDCTPSAELYLILKILPLIRAVFALYVMIRWVIKYDFNNLLISYLFTTAIVTYLSALIFFSYEVGVNPKIDSFGDSIWWAGMSVTTVGAEVFAVTAIGKVLSVLLPGVGMMLFPIFTTNFILLYQNRRKRLAKDPDEL